MAGGTTMVCAPAAASRPLEFESIRLESDPVIAVVSTLLTGAVLIGVLVSLALRQRSSHAH
jgi:ABC-type spermidine/putrescine transport system permease subunit II